MKYERLEKFVSLSQGLVVNKGTAGLFSDVQDDEHPYPLLRITDFENGNHANYSKYVSKDVPPKNIIDEDAILFTRVTCQCFRGFSGVFHNNLFRVELINDELSEDYLYVILQSDYVKRQALQYTSSSVVPDLSHDKFKTILIPVPDRNVQDAIARIYLSLQSKIDNNNAICSDLEGVAKLLYDYWFVQFDFPDENGKPYKSSGGKMVWNDELKREIPAGWEAGVLGDVIEKYTDGISSNNIGDLPYTPMDILPMRQMTFSETGSREDANSSLIRYKKYSLMFGAMRPYFHRVCIAPFDGITRTTVFTLRERGNGELGYAFETLDQDYTVNYANAHHVGTQQPYAEWDGNLEKCPIPLPPTDLRREYSQMISDHIDIVIERNLENQQLASLRDFLLPMLMNGQVKVGKAGM